MKSIIFGHTRQQLPIPCYKFGSNGPRVLIIGGVHGDEKEGVIAACGLLDRFAKQFAFKLRVTLVPALNLDGVINSTRKNFAGVDLNRNLPTGDWTSHIDNERYYPGPEPNSEPENKALVHYLESQKPRLVMSLHSWKPCLNVNGKCRPEAEAIAQRTGYEIVETIGYPTPGCLGTYAGLERDQPTLTYEIEKDLDAQNIMKIHVPAILEALKVTETYH